MTKAKRRFLYSASLIPQPLGRRTGFLLNQAADQVRRLTAEALAPFNISLRQVGILEVIAHCQREEIAVTQQEIGERMNIDRTSIGVYVDGLMKGGYLERRPHPEDGRAYLVALSPGGADRFQAVLDIVEAVQDRFLSPLTRSEWEQMHLSLIKLLEQS